MEEACKAIAQRIVNAETNFKSNITDQFGFNSTEADTIFSVFKKVKAVKLDSVLGKYQLKSGEFWNKDVMKRALEY